jgi:hypothetical protein
MPWVAVTLVKHGEWLAARGRAEEASTALDEARTILERLKATPWLDRIERVLVPLSGTGAEAAS